MNLLVDSSVWLRILSGRVSTKIVDYMADSETEHQFVSTGMVRLEVMVGARDWHEMLNLQLFFAGFPAEEPTTRTWDEAGRLSLRMKSKGYRLRAQDLLIASVALENDLTLLHADSDFECLAEHEGLKTESLLHLLE